VKPVFDPAQLQYLGAYQMPGLVGAQGNVVRGRGLATRLLNGVPKFLFTGYDGSGGYLLFETTIPDVSTLDPAHPKVLTGITQHGQIFGGDATKLGVRHQAVTGLYFDPVEQALVVHSGNEYDNNPADETVGHQRWVNNAWVPGGRVGLTLNGGVTKRSGKAAQGGMCAIPAWFSNAYCPGKYLLSGWGGYRSLVQTGPASMGPSVCAHAFPPEVTDLVARYIAGTELVNYPFSTTLPTAGPDRCRRGDDYQNAFGGDCLWHTQHSSWTWGDWIWQAGTWIDTPSASGLICFPSQLVGKGWYTNTLNWTNTKHAVLVYDPADLAAVAAGSKKAWQIQPVVNQDWHFPGLTYPLGGGADEPAQLVTGCTLDVTGQLLYLQVRNVGPVSGVLGHVPYVYVYRIPQSLPTPRPCGKPTFI